MSTNLDEVIGLCRYCTKPLGDSPPPACAHCIGLETKGISRIKQPDPYKKVWNTAEDEEAVLLEWVKNGTLFVPTWEDLARRHVSKAKFLLNQARKHGRTAEGHSVFKEAMFHRNMAQECVDRHREVLLKSR